MTILDIPTLTTQNLTLRAAKPADFEAYASYRSSARSQTVGGPYDRSASFTHFCTLAGHWQYRGYGRWIVADRVTDQALGVVGPYYPIDWPEPEIAWTVFNGAEGRGIAYEAAMAARLYAYGTLKWPTVMSAISPDNTRSLSLARRMGANHESDFDHPEYGILQIWRHVPPAECI